MNGLSLSELCYLFCCPPCPSRITAKLAFLPPAPTYAFIEEDSPSSSNSSSSPSPPVSNCSLHLTEKAEWQYSRSELEVIDVFYTRSRRGNRVACMYVKITDSPEFTILFSHGNAVDLGQMSSFFIGLGNRINCNILAYDYSGYGASTGKASEANIYSDAEAAWETLKTRFGLRPDQVILYGQSIGTAATVDLATRHEVAGVVLHSPLMSGMRVACPDVRRTWCFDSFASIEKITRVTSPVLVIHGTDDEVIDFTHGLALFERAPRTVEPLWVEGAGHNDVELYGQYLDRLRKFIQVDIRSS